MSILPHEKQIVEYQNSDHDLLSSKEMSRLEKKLEKLKKKVYSSLTPWERVQICRHPDRPHFLDFLQNITTDYVEIFGDRTFKDDKAIITALGYVKEQKFVFIGQEKGNNTESRIYRNFGMPHPEGYRKALRAMQLAEKFSLPVVCFIDTPGAYPGLSAEERGQGWAIAKNLREMSQLQTPILVFIIGEGCSGGALGIGVGDHIAMLEHSYYSVISPEGCASILWNDTAKNAKAARALKMHAEDLRQLDIIDQIIPEPLGGAHHDVNSVYTSVTQHILQQVQIFHQMPIQILLDKRYQRFRKMGKFIKDPEVS
jgi:acetyl-CoA carboxylase carboxyl transferase subunit alpha